MSLDKGIKYDKERRKQYRGRKAYCNGWRYDYYDKLISLYKFEPNKIILVPTDIQIMNRLEYEEIPFALVFPSYELKEEYRNRYLKRGNTNDFIDVFIGDWDYWIGMFKIQKGCKKFSLKQTNIYRMS